MAARGKHASKNMGMGLKGRPSHRAEVTAMFPPCRRRMVGVSTGEGTRKPFMNRQPATPPKLTHGRPAARRSIKSLRRRGEQSDSEADMPRPARQSAAGAPAPLPARWQWIDAVAVRLSRPS
jgi:hypothetical protein